jgi:hypothetical protein
MMAPTIASYDNDDLQALLAPMARRFCPDENDQQKLVEATIATVTLRGDRMEDVPIDMALFFLMRDLVLHEPLDPIPMANANRARLRLVIGGAVQFATGTKSMKEKKPDAESDAARSGTEADKNRDDLVKKAEDALERSRDKKPAE